MNVTLVRIFFLIVMWWICSGIAEPFFLVSGVVCVWLCWKIVERMQLLDEESLFHKPLPFFFYFAWLIKEIAVAAIGVTRIIWQVKPRITPRLVEIDTKLKSDLALSLYGNSITLTPGTACVHAAHKKMQVHTLVKTGVADLKSGRMEKEVAKITLNCNHLTDDCAPRHEARGAVAPSHFASGRLQNARKTVIA